MSTSAILKKLYPKVNNNISKNISKYTKVLSKFIESRSEALYDTCPCNPMYFKKSEYDELFEVIGISEAEVQSVLNETYYAKIAAFNPAAAKDPFTILLLSIIRYFFLKRDKKYLELSMIYLAFSGKFYTSVYYGSFHKVPPSEYRHIMEYVVNNMMTNKYDLVTQGSVIGAIKSICNSWCNAYEKRFREFDDEDVVYIIQQLHNRIKSFMKNIASLYYEAYTNRNMYLTYDSDNLGDDNYRLADNDALLIERIVQHTTNYIANNKVNYICCKRAANQDVKTDEVKSIIESIVSEQDNLDEIKELIQSLIVTYFQSSKNRDIRNIDFVTFSITSKPNTKDKLILRQKEIISNWLETNSVSYKRRKSRIATRISYNKTILTYFVLITYEANK